MSRRSSQTRDRILDAALHVMRTRGFARTTTKEVARAAGYSEAMIYKHFADKSDLFLAVLRERLPSFTAFIGELADGPPAAEAAAAEATAAAGRPVRERLAGAARAAVRLYLEGFPISASLFAEPAQLAAHREAIAGRGAGPRGAVAALAGYLRAEQRRGRVRADADCDAAAALLIGSCFQYAFLCCFEQRQPDDAEIDAYAAATTDTLLAGISAQPGRLPGTDAAAPSAYARARSIDHSARYLTRPRGMSGPQRPFRFPSRRDEGTTAPGPDGIRGPPHPI